MKRKLLSIAMIAVLCLTMLPTAGWATDGEIDDWQVPEAPTTTGSWTDAGNYEINWYTDNPSATDFELEDAADLAGLAAIVNGTAKNASGATIKDDFAGDTITVKSGSTIDLKDKQWTPIGNRAAYAFKGTFDGKNVEITGMTISGDSAISGAGLFGYVNNGIVQNVSVSGAYINATIANNGAVGGIVGILTGTQNDESNQGKISNCSFSGNIIVNGKELVTCAGGIVGSVSSLGYGGVYPNLIVESCENKATIQGVAIYMGGIAGNNGKADTIKSCTNNGKLQSTRYSQNALGGIVGYTQGAVEQCENKAVVTSIGRTTPADGYGTYYVGGIAGLMRACEISGCKNTAAVSSVHSVYMGGIAGGYYLVASDSEGGKITDCHNSAPVTNTGNKITSTSAIDGTTTGGILGGFFDNANESIEVTKCSNTAAISVGSEDLSANVGGILGRGPSSSFAVQLSQCYNAGDVTITTSKNAGVGGGLSGTWTPSAGGESRIENCYNVGKIANETELNIPVGGLIGNGSNVSLSDCYQAGAVESKGSDQVDAMIGNGSSVTATYCHYWSGCGATSAHGTSQAANTLTEDESWATSLGFDTTIWEKSTNPTMPQDGKVIGYLPVLTANKQSSAPTLERVTDKNIQDPLTITNKPENDEVHQDAAPFTLGVSGGSGTGAVTWAISNGQEMATIDPNTGTITLAPEASGNVTVTVTKAGDEKYLPAEASYQFKIVTDPIDSVTIYGLKVPVVGETPADSYTVPENAHYWAMVAAGVGTAGGSVFWMPSDISTFEQNGSYSVSVRLKPNTNYTFATPTEIVVNLDGVNMDFVQSVSTEIVDGDNLKITVTFKMTTHEHNYDRNSWESDALHHWHGCIAEGCPLFTEDMPGYAKHTDSDNNDICDTCEATIGYTITFNANGGACTTASARTDLDGKIATLPEASREGYTFRGWFTAASGGEQVTLDKVYSADTTLYAQWEKIPEPPYTGKYSYEIFTDDSEHGALDVDRYATEGEKVTITVLPDDGYALDEIVITDKHGEEIDFVDNGDGTITFTMPSGDVTITATFAESDEPECALPFVDVHANDWFYDPVCYVYREGLMTGTSATTFAPNATTTRAMIVSILARQENVTAAEEAGFTDVAENDWFATAVNWAAREGIVAGFEDESFRPNEAITREQLAAILCNYSAWKGKDTSARADLDEYTDAISISSWATDTMSWAVAEQLLAGVTENTLEPQGAATRAQVAAVLQRFLSE